MSNTNTPDYSGGQGQVIIDEDDRYRLFAEMRYAPLLTRIIFRWLPGWYPFRSVESVYAIIGAAIGIPIGSLLILAHFFGEAVWSSTGMFILIVLFGALAYFASSVIVRLAEAVVGALDGIEDLSVRWRTWRRRW